VNLVEEREIKRSIKSEFYCTQRNSLKEKKKQE